MVTATRLAWTVQEAADQIGISRASLYRLVQTGEVPSFTIGRSRRITNEALERFVRRLAEEQAVPA